MTFMSLNGVTIPTQKGGTYEVQEIGARSQAFDGTAQIDIRARKRKFKMTTKPVNPLTAAMLRGLINGSGVTWQWNFGGAASELASNGLAATAGSGTMAFPSAFANDGLAIKDELGNFQVFGNGNIAVPVPATTTPNLLSAQVATPTAVTGFSSFGGTTIAYTTIASYTSGGGAISCAGTTGGLTHSTINGTKSAFYVGSVYIRTSTGTNSSMNMTFADLANSVNRQVSMSVTTIWQRFAVTLQAGSVSTPTLQIEVAFGTGTNTFYIAGLQIELATNTAAGLTQGTGLTSGWPTPWTVTASRSVTTLNYQTGVAGQHGITFNFYTSGFYQWSPTTNTDVFSVFNSSTLVASLTCAAATTTQTMTYTTVGQSATSTILLPSSNAYNMVTITLWASPVTGEFNEYVYINGALSSSKTYSNWFYDPNNWNSLYVGSNGTGSPYQGKIAFLEVLKYPMTAAGVLQKYNMTSYWINQNGGFVVGTPYSVLQGDSMSGGTVAGGTLVLGQIIDSTYNGVFTQSTKTWQSASEQLEFAIQEV